MIPYQPGSGQAAAVMAKIEREGNSWYFEPSHPLWITSGLRKQKCFVAQKHKHFIEQYQNSSPPPCTTKKNQAFLLLLFFYAPDFLFPSLLPLLHHRYRLIALLCCHRLFYMVTSYVLREGLVLCSFLFKSTDVGTASVSLLGVGEGGQGTVRLNSDLNSHSPVPYQYY